ncbi:MAG: ribosome-binding factor A [Actinobacteria bacterium HGW-Actinobacteria-4]|nr:MAG: ribosome-binding factor A [Actinobacteria bacterium HGW-Actinobacteria-4]
MVDSARALKLAGTIKKIVARALETEIKDPRLGFVTITDVRVTGDLQQASVFYTVYGGEEEREGTAAALASARGRLRSIMGSQLGIRLTPTLDFFLDALPETAATLDKALHEAAEKDAELARLRANATYAGDEDPYKKPHEELDEADDDGDDDEAAEDDQP